ncbi:hypothetical protein [Kitasatospora sp. NPDC056273]|uniref:hypothetical protein n=1 Tax=Kitasatospora sp. NPDC056273 TaxID=3345769 RepID=UPI0035D994F2
MSSNGLRRNPRSAAAVGLAALALGLTGLGGGQAVAAPQDDPRTIGTPVTMSESAITAASLPCITSPGVKTCFDKAGDKVLVLDTAKDGFSAVGRWSTDYGRTGACRNALGVGHWAECNYDMRETGHIQLNNALYDGDTGLLVLTDTYSGWLSIG